MDMGNGDPATGNAIMGSSIVTLLFIQVLLIVLNAVFASAELAVLSVNETKLERLAGQGNKRAKRLYKLTQEPAKFLSTIQIAITLSGFLGSAFAADGFSDPLVEWALGLGTTLSRQTLDTIAVIFITLVLSYFTLIFGELVPKRIAMKKSEELALGVSGIVSGISVLFKPVVWLLSVSTNAILRLLRIDPNETDDHVGEEEIRMMVETGAIDKEEQDFIRNVFEFDDLTAGEILTHRTDVTILWMEDSDAVWEETVCNSRFSSYPVCDGSPDHVIGILNAKDYLRLKERSREIIMEKTIEPAYFVPETIKADVLFRNMKKIHKGIAVVLDEYGGMAGIVTLNDLIEELVGELQENSAGEGVEQPPIELIEENTWRISGNASLDEIEKELDIKFGADNIYTFTGFVFDKLNGIPGDGEPDIKLECDGISILIKRIKNHQIALAEIRKNPGGSVSTL